MARILRQTTVIRDGWHNAFTDLIYWQGCYWISYRKGTNHATMDGEVVVACSIDRTRFREVAHIKVPGDNRDPKLILRDNDTLAIYFPSWLGDYTAAQLQHFIAFSDNGRHWSQPQQILDRGKWLWRIRQHDGLWYGLIEGITDNPRTYYLEIVTSSDLVSWQHHCYVGSAEQNLNESDITWLADGTAWIVSRSAAEDNAYFSHASAPYQNWTTIRLNTRIHAPAILQHEGKVYVTGRRFPDLEDDAETYPFLCRHSIGIWEVTHGAVRPVLRIPATGDCSYSGFIKDPDGRICLTYYSQHAYQMGVIPPPMRLEPQAPHDIGQLLTPNDVYFAELQLP